tara:strand:- start:537 stop:863 length:327 start_codon:yes stop_codon:yes gene_type:complete
MTIIHKVNSEELVKLLEYSDMPVIVNMPESLIWAIPLYVRDRSKFVTCQKETLPFGTSGARMISMQDELYQAGRNKSQILKDMAAKLTADGIDTVCLDFTTQGDDDDD